MKTTNIKGKPYVMVNERLKEFRSNPAFSNWSLESEVVKLDENGCVIKAIIKDDDGVIKATGLAQEDKSSSMINKTSYVENCETSAWGRALGNLGIGIDDSVASADEVQMAIRKQEELATPEQVAQLRELAVNEENVCKHYGVKRLEELSFIQACEAIEIKEKKNIGMLKEEK